MSSFATALLKQANIVFAGDNESICALSTIVGITVAVWVLLKTLDVCGCFGAGAANDTPSEAPKKMGCARTATLDSYDRSNITNAEVAKLMNTKEFADFWGKNAARIIAQNDAALQTPLCHTMILAVLSLAAMAYLPFLKSGTGEEVHLFQLFPVREFVIKAFSQTTMDQYLSTAFWTDYRQNRVAFKLAMFAFYVATSLSRTSLGKVLSIFGLLWILLNTGTLTLSLGVIALAALTGVRLYL